jgi:hypothetical protein
VNSWPAPVVDWRRLTPQLGHGDLVCVVHGRVDAARGPWELPICPRCEQLLSQAQCDRRTGALIGFAEPHPAYCAGPQRHPYTPGAGSGWAGGPAPARARCRGRVGAGGGCVPSAASPPSFRPTRMASC